MIRRAVEIGCEIASLLGAIASVALLMAVMAP